MRRPALVLAATALIFVAAGCGDQGTALPTAKTVEGTLTTEAPEGDATAGKTLFSAQGCNGCHTYTPAGSNATIGPNLDNLEADAKKANSGSVEEYTMQSIVNPDSYTVPGFPKGVMPSYASLSAKQVADLVAFLTKP